MTQYLSEIFKTLPDLKTTDRTLLLTHNDMDGAGAVILLKNICSNITVTHCSNKNMSWQIKNAVTNPQIANQYDKIIICDISCNKEDACKINASPNRNKVILLDHHDSALELNQYPWAVVKSDVPIDSFRADRYNQTDQAHSSGTSLLYDYLEMHHLTDRIPNRSLARKMVHTIAAYDTWDWVNCYDSDELFDNMDIVCDAYGIDLFEERWINKLQNKDSLLFDETDELLIRIQKNKTRQYLKGLDHAIHTGNIRFADQQKFYSVVFCTTDSYFQKTFEKMKEDYPDFDLYMINTLRSLSFRATKKNIHVGKLLKSCGGGGHQGAGGIRVPAALQRMLTEQTLNASFFIDDRETTRKYNKNLPNQANPV